MTADRRPPSAKPPLGTATSLNFCSPDAGGHCITCSDEALTARVIELDFALALAKVEVNSQTIEVDISLIDQVVVGQLLLVHGGVAMGRLDEPEP